MWDVSYSWLNIKDFPWYFFYIRDIFLNNGKKIKFLENSLYKKEILLYNELN